MRTIFRTRRSLLIEALYMATWLVVLFVVMPHMCKRLAYSFFYQPNSESPYELINAENQRRADIAGGILASNNFKHLFNKVNITKEVDVCIAVLTTPRPHFPRYLTQTVASLARQLHNLRLRYSFAVYNVRGMEHTEAVSIAKHVPVIHNNTATLAKTRSQFDTQRISYASVMRWCLSKNARYNIILEDDIIMADDFVSNLQFILDHCIADKEGKDWGFLKLYYPEKYQGWGNYPSTIVELIMFTLMFGFLFTLISAAMCVGPMSVDLKSWRVNIRWPVMYFRLTFTHVCVLFVLLSLGRAHWEELRKLSPLMISVVEAKGCCVPAVLYPRPHYHELVEFLETRRAANDFPFDLLLDQFIDKRGLGKLLAIPNMGNHIGMVSSITSKGQKRALEFDLLFPPHF